MGWGWGWGNEVICPQSLGFLWLWSAPFCPGPETEGNSIGEPVT